MSDVRPFFLRRLRASLYNCICLSRRGKYFSEGRGIWFPEQYKDPCITFKLQGLLAMQNSEQKPLSHKSFVPYLHTVPTWYRYRLMFLRFFGDIIGSGFVDILKKLHIDWDLTVMRPHYPPNNVYIYTNVVFVGNTPQFKYWYRPPGYQNNWSIGKCSCVQTSKK
jgi:hypothetical protein